MLTHAAGPTTTISNDPGDTSGDSQVSRYEGLIRVIPPDYTAAREALAKVSETPLDSAFEHSEAMGLARKLRRAGEAELYTARSLLFKDISRLKNPEIKIINFSAAQHAEVDGLMRPGNIILTYIAGYASDVFNPGNFKHGITYVGSPEDRKKAGASSALLPGFATRERAEFEEDLNRV